MHCRALQRAKKPAPQGARFAWMALALRMRQRHDGADDVVTSLWIDAAILNVTGCLFCGATIVNADTTLAAAWQ
jgi:hypothetical protein